MRPVAGVTHSAIIDPDFRQAIKNFAEPMGAKFKTGKEVGGGYLGVYDPATKQVLHRQATPESTFAHESGHFFDDKFKLKQRFYKRGESKGIANELIEHMRKMGESPARMAKPEERFARGFEWWLTQRHLAETDLPLFSAEMQKIITDIPELKPLLDIRPSPNKSFETQRTTIFAPDTRPQTPTSIKFKVAGEHKSMSVSPELYKAMMNMNPEHTGWLVNILAIPKRTLQMGATITPDFILRNPIRDQFSAFQQTQIKFRPFWDIPKAMADHIKKGDLYNEYLMSGSPHAGIVALNQGRRGRRHINSSSKTRVGRDG